MVAKKAPETMTLIAETHYRCPECDRIIPDQERRCSDCNKFASRYMVYLECPHCYELIGEDDLQ